MTDEKYGPASLAATAFAPSPLSGQEPTSPGGPVLVSVGGQVIAPASSASGGPATHVPHSGVGPASAATGEATAAGPIGRTILGRYKIKRLLGEGGMGGVYEGEHLEIGKRVAIKLVHALHARDPHVAARIKQEARSTGAIESENIVQVFDAGEDPEVGIFLVMEMLKGEDLCSLLARKKRISPMAAASMVVQAAQGLSRAHAAGIVHRDLKPANVFLCARDDGSSLVKLVDFGIAKLVRDANRANHEGHGPSLTRMGMVIGTPQYMSPEQAQGLLTVDHRTDVYSLGAVLFEACVGHSPFLELPTYEQTILQIMTRPAPRISSEVPDVHPDLDQLCADMMAHDMNARPRDMAAVRERLLRIFPALEGGRLPMRSLSSVPMNEIGYDATVSADASGQIRAQIDAGLARAALSGVSLAIPRPTPSLATQSALAAPATEQPSIASVSGAAPRRNGAIIGVVAVLALAAGIGLVALVKMHDAPPSPPAAASFGLVQSTVAAPSVVPAASPPQPAAAPVAIAPTPLAPIPRAADVPVTTPLAATKSAAGHASSTKAKGAAPSQASPAAPAKAGAKEGSTPIVGGTSESTEF